MREGWKEVELEELGIIGRGKSRHRPRNADFLYGNEYPFVQTADVKAAEYKITSYSQMYSEAGLTQSKLWPINTLCITIAANIADSSILGIEACFPDSVVGFISDPLKSDVKFVKYLFDMLQIRIKQISQGAAQDNLSLEKIRTLRFTVPNVETQRKIATILSGYDDLIENNLKRIKILEEMAQQTYEEWFVRMRFPGYETAKIDEVTGLPEGWEKVKCFDAMEVLSGGTPKTNVDDYWNGGIEFFTPKDAKSGSYTNGTEKTVTELGVKKCNSKLYPRDTVFITARGTVGKLNLASKPMIMNQSCYALKGRNEISQFFLFCAMNSTIETFKSASNGGVFNTIIVDTFKFLDFIIPNTTLIENFENFAKPLFTSVHNLQSQNQRLREARDILLPRLMMGIVEV